MIKSMFLNVMNPGRQGEYSCRREAVNRVSATQKCSVHSLLLALLCAACSGTPSVDPGLEEGSDTQEAGTGSSSVEEAKNNRTALKKQLATKEKRLEQLGTFAKGRCQPQWDKLAHICTKGPAAVGDVDLCTGIGGSTCVPNKEALGLGNDLNYQSFKSFCSAAGNDPDAIGAAGGPHDDNACMAPVIVSDNGKELVALCQNVLGPDAAAPNICIPNASAGSPAENGPTLNHLHAYCAGRIDRSDVESGALEKARFACEKVVVVDGTGNLDHVKTAQGKPVCVLDAKAPSTINPEVANWCGDIHAKSSCNMTQGCGWNSSWSAPVVSSDNSGD